MLTVTSGATELLNHHASEAGWGSEVVLDQADVSGDYHIGRGEPRPSDVLVPLGGLRLRVRSDLSDKLDTATLLSRRGSEFIVKRSQPYPFGPLIEKVVIRG
jgi:hypothetical protein